MGQLDLPFRTKEGIGGLICSVVLCISEGAEYRRFCSFTPTELHGCVSGGGACFVCE
jgi:hypothetical protein